MSDVHDPNEDLLPSTPSSPDTRMKQNIQGKNYSPEVRKAKQELFLKSFAINANVMVACRQASIDRTLVRYWEEHDEEFGFRYRQAKQDADDLIRAELHRRSINGYDKPVTSMGKLIYDKNGRPLSEKVYSDTLLSLLAKARLPEFREKQQVDVTHTHAHSLTIDTRSLSGEQLEALKAFAMDLKERSEK